MAVFFFMMFSLHRPHATGRSAPAGPTAACICVFLSFDLALLGRRLGRESDSRHRLRHQSESRRVGRLSADRTEFCSANTIPPRSRIRPRRACDSNSSVATRHCRDRLPLSKPDSRRKSPTKIPNFLRFVQNTRSQPEAFMHARIRRRARSLYISRAVAALNPRHRRRPTSPRLLRRLLAHRTPVGRKNARHPQHRQSPRLHAAPHRASAQRRHAPRQGIRRMDRSPNLKSSASTRTSKHSTCSIPRRKNASSNSSMAARNSPPSSQEPALSAGSNFQSTNRTAPHLQRLLHRRRRHRAARLRQLRHPRRLRAARAHGRLRQRHYRHRALWPLLARHQAQSRRRTRRRRLPHLFRSARRRLLRRAKLFRKAPWRPRDGVQRGSVQTCPFYSGDPLTPGIGATTDAKRLKIEDAPTHHKNSRAPDFLRRRAAACSRPSTGPRRSRRAGAAALPITYRIGPGPAKVHLKVFPTGTSKPLYDVIAKIPGSKFPDEWVIRGNHHDAWVNGAEDPISGMDAVSKKLARSASCSSRLEAQAHHHLLRVGRRRARPARFHRMGRRHTPTNSQKTPSPTSIPTPTAAASLHVEGSHTLEKFANDVARDIARPRNETLRLEALATPDIANAHPIRSARQEAAPARRPSHRRARLRLRPRRVPEFPRHRRRSISASAVKMSGGIYHSIYDDFYWYTHFSDTDFVYGRALAQTAGTTVMRLADADLLPFRIHRFRRHDADVRQGV